MSSRLSFSFHPLLKTTLIIVKHDGKKNILQKVEAEHQVKNKEQEGANMKDDIDEIKIISHSITFYNRSKINSVMIKF